MTKASSPISGKNIVLGVTGGIAAYKAADLASKLTAAGAKVYTVMTENACKLILPKTFEALTGLPVFTTMWTEPQDFKIKHVDLADDGRHRCRCAGNGRCYRQTCRRHLRRYAYHNALCRMEKTDPYRAGDER